MNIITEGGTLPKANDDKVSSINKEKSKGVLLEPSNILYKKRADKIIIFKCLLLILLSAVIFKASLSYSVPS